MLGCLCFPIMFMNTMVVGTIVFPGDMESLDAEAFPSWYVAHTPQHV